MTAILQVCGAAQPTTYCNPLDLDYRFQFSKPSHREAADPAVVQYQGEYWLFASKSGGYWHSKDFSHWTFVEGKELPIEAYAPAPAVINGQLYYTAFTTRSIYRAEDPGKGKWIKAGELKPYGDPALFQDDDGKVYVYYGCSPNGGISGVELDPTNGFKEIGQPVVCLKCDPPQRGWEVPGDENAGKSRGEIGNSWIEGAWMTKCNKKYYLQYAAPGTQFRSYGDGVFVGESPLGPFTYAPYSPFSQKPTGFITGAGHSGTFQDFHGHWWRVVTMVVSVRASFERRVGLFPVGFLDDGQMYCNTYLGDYPQFLPDTSKSSARNNSPDWMLLSLGKPAEASSESPGYSVTNAFNENIQHWWCAKTGGAGEWLKVDLTKVCRINALQINFADEGAQALSKLQDDSYQYYVEASTDGSKWEKIVDQSKNHRDAPHDFEQLENPVQARYVRLVNVHCPADAKFSVSGFRIFGNGLGRAPTPAKDIVVVRNPNDGRKATVSWKAGKRSDFYVVRFGLAPDRLFNNYQIYNSTNAVINSLNSGIPYYFAVDSINDSGVTKGKTTVLLRQ